MSKRKLLLADDSVTIQKVVNLTFADEGIEVISVGDGDTAMEKFVEVSPDLVMADVNMPGLTGYQLCEKIRMEAANNQTPVILLVGSFEPFDEEEARRVGADDYLTKPFQSIRQLVNKVTVLLNSSEAETAKLPEIEPKPQVSSFDDTLEMQKPDAENTPTVEYNDTGFDDEMIETNSISSYTFDESQKFESRPTVEPETEYSAFAATQPLTNEEIKEFELVDSVAPNIEDKVEETVETVAETSETISEEVAETAETVSEEVAETAETVSDEVTETAETISNEVEESVENVEDEVAETAETIVNETVAEEEILETGSTVEEEIATTEYAIEESEAEEIVAETETTEASAVEETPAAETEDEMPLPEVASILQLDEANPLELPPIEADGTDENESDEASNLVSIPTTAASAPTSSVSPEIIDEIVQKVMEKLSEKTVKDIAWEVVPEVTERVVKKMAEEKLK